MPRYLVERVFDDGLRIPTTAEGAATCRAVVEVNATYGVTWVTSYVSTDKLASYCIYDGPGPDQVRAAAEANQLPFDRITEVRVLDPYFYVQEPQPG